MFSNQSSSSYNVSSYESSYKKKDVVSVQTLFCLGLLQCVTEDKDMSKVFFAVLQEGGVDDHKTINCNDKDFDRNFPKMFELASTAMVNYYVKYGNGTQRYTPTEITTIESTFK